MTLPVEGYQLKGISARAFEHPADRAATAALASIPGLDQVVRKLIELGYERALRVAYLGSSVRLGPGQLPETWNLHNQVFRTLDLDDVPELYVTQFPVANASTIGAGRPIVVVNSELVRLLRVEERRAVLAHEAAHVLADHVLYFTALQILLRMGTSVRLPILAGLPLMAVRQALLEWSRAAEMSCDRAAALATRDPEAVCRTLMILAAGAEADALDLSQFMAQAAEYQAPASGLERLSRMLTDLNVTHPMPVRRAQELMAWVRSGDYDRIVGGDYLRRGEEADARTEAGDAVNHYADRFRNAFKEAGEAVRDAGDAVGSATEQLADWLKKDR
ncbi:MAG TPA: M48 family metallopeptidase [Baekduia sp.]|uniref:M48 family metallopeptidase n=1 Tax=Baekduia sp. TaxID=2600305 RepID=UPI002D797CC0|nr:M48 family metallopeptidase [Baekduia sp.]HET6509805.1 M48 family metallopeptidase [Baekduia sp.]